LEEKQSSFLTLKSNFSNNIAIITTILFAILNIASFIISLISLTKKETLEWYIIITIIIFNSIFIIILTICMSVIYYNHRKHLRESDEFWSKDNNILKDRLKLQLEKSINLKQRFQSITNYLTEINRILNKFLTKIYQLNEDYFSERSSFEKSLNNFDKLTTSVDLKSDFEERKKHIFNNYSVKIMDEYKTFLRNITINTKLAILEQLENKDFSLNISLCIKQFNQILHHKNFGNDDNYSDIFIYSAFRDYETYISKEREIGSIKYNIGSNTEYSHCIEKEWYINNKLELHNESSYSNQNKSFLKFYDATVIVPIICYYKNENQIYGYFACDAKKGEEYKDKEIFDLTIARIMFAVALNIGVYYDNIGYAWSHLFRDKYKDFLDFIQVNYFEFNNNKV